MYIFVRGPPMDPHAAIIEGTPDTDAYQRFNLDR